MSGRPGQVALKPEVEQVVTQQQDLLGAVQQPHVAGQPELERVLSQQSITEGMEGVDRGIGLPVRD